MDMYSPSTALAAELEFLERDKADLEGMAILTVPSSLPKEHETKEDNSAKKKTSEAKKNFTFI
ncbi:MAG: hypothetical protein II397_03365, partial [Treponema sp.]|nr:hypothetical protein [Treponema sp.]